MALIINPCDPCVQLSYVIQKCSELYRRKNYEHAFDFLDAAIQEAKRNKSPEVANLLSKYPGACQRHADKCIYDRLFDFAIKEYENWKANHQELTPEDKKELLDQMEEMSQMYAIVNDLHKLVKILFSG